MVIARTAGIFLGLAVLSFVLGFFVLAKLVPGAPHTASASALPATDLSSPGLPDTGVPADSPREAGPARGPAPSPTQTASATGTAKPKITRGPSLDPETDGPAPADATGVQAPRKVNPDGQTSTAAADSNDDTASAGDPADEVKSKPSLAAKKKHRRRIPARMTEIANDKSDEATTGSDESTSDAADAAARSRQTRRTSKPADESDDNTDANAAGPDRSGPSKKEDSASHGTLYHVRLGSFHSREAADSEVERARAKGFPTRVVPVTHNGRTLYRVQAGAFRDRERAEAIKQSLQDASLDASVSEQRR